MYLKCLQKTPMRRVENKVEFLERRGHSKKLSFVHKKETEHSFCHLSFIDVFSILKYKTLVLKTTT